MVKVLFLWKVLAVNSPSLRAQPEAKDCSLQILSSALAASRTWHRSKYRMHMCVSVSVSVYKLNHLLANKNHVCRVVLIRCELVKMVFRWMLLFFCD